MATTIYGCVNRSTDEIDFEVCAPADFSGCIVRDGGIHHGQVKLITTYSGCDDTYYGCVNRTTGKFEVIVPDDCCGYGYGDDCGYCAEGETPLKILVAISGVTDCPCAESVGGGYWEADGAAANINGGHTLTQTGNPCVWRVDIHFVYKLNYSFESENCDGPIYDRDYTRALSVTKINANTVEIMCDSSFEGSGVVESGCVTVTSISNNVPGCWTRGLDHPAMNGGTASIVELA